MNRLALFAIAAIIASTAPSTASAAYRDVAEFATWSDQHALQYTLYLDELHFKLSNLAFDYTQADCPRASWEVERLQGQILQVTQAIRDLRDHKRVLDKAKYTRTVYAMDRNLSRTLQTARAIAEEEQADTTAHNARREELQDRLDNWSAEHI